LQRGTLLQVANRSTEIDRFELAASLSRHDGAFFF
jgi:hypothetical protein